MIDARSAPTACRGRRLVASVTVTHVPGTTYQTRIDTGDLALIADEPLDAGGDGLGPSPYELLLAGLGHCTVLTILLYARRKGWPLDGVSVRASHERVVVAEEIDGELIRKKVGADHPGDRAARRSGRRPAGAPDRDRGKVSSAPDDDGRSRDSRRSKSSQDAARRPTGHRFRVEAPEQSSIVLDCGPHCPSGDGRQ